MVVSLQMTTHADKKMKSSLFKTRIKLELPENIKALKLERWQTLYGDEQRSLVDLKGCRKEAKQQEGQSETSLWATQTGTQIDSLINFPTRYWEIKWDKKRDESRVRLVGRSLAACLTTSS